MTDEINRILSEWDPIETGYPFSLNEYLKYSQRIKLFLNDKSKLKLYLIEVIEQMGLIYNPENKDQEEVINNVIQKLTRLVEN